MLKKETKENDQEKNEDKYILQINKDRREQKYFFYVVKFLYTLYVNVFSSLVTICSARRIYIVAPCVCRRLYACCSILLFYSLENRTESMFYAPHVFFFIFIVFALCSIVYTIFNFNFIFHKNDGIK